VDPIHILRDLIEQSSDGAIEDRDLWRERGRAALVAIHGQSDHPEIRRFEQLLAPRVVKSNQTIRSGQFAEASARSLLAARSLLVATVELEAMSSSASTADSESVRDIAESILVPDGPGDYRSVFMVHGRDSENVAAMKQFLHSLDLRVVDWEEAVAQTGRANPYVGDVLDVGFAMADAVLVVFTPDDIVRLRPDLITESDGPDEREERGQPRANVIYEAGMAQSRASGRTAIVSIGRLKVFSDIAGVHVPQFDGSPESRHRLVGRLRLCGLTLNTTGPDWLSAGHFVDPPDVPGNHEPLDPQDAEPVRDIRSRIAAADDGPGFLEVLLEMEDSMPAYTVNLATVTERSRDIASLMRDGTDRLQQSDSRGGGVRGRLTIAIQVAQELEPIVEDIEGLALEQDALVDGVDRGIEYIFGRVERGEIAPSEEDEAMRMLEAVKELGKASDEASTAVSGHRAVLPQLGSAARPLRRVTTKLDQALELIVDNFEKFSGWGDRAAHPLSR